MIGGRQSEKRILAIDVASRGFGYAVLEGSRLLIDWGVKETRENKQKNTLAFTTNLIGRYQPDVVVLEDSEAKGSRRCKRIQGLIENIKKLALSKAIRTITFSRRAVKKTFLAGAVGNKDEIAQAVAQNFSELRPRVPPVRKPWMSEDPRTAMFNAVALAVTYFEKRK